MCLPPTPCPIASLHQHSEMNLPQSPSQVNGLYSRSMPNHVHMSLPTSTKYHWVLFKKLLCTHKDRPTAFTHYRACHSCTFAHLFHGCLLRSPISSTAKSLPTFCATDAEITVSFESASHRRHVQHSIVLGLAPHIKVGLWVRFLLNTPKAVHWKTPGCITR